MRAYVIKTADGKYWNGGKVKDDINTMTSNTLAGAKLFKTDDEANEVFESIEILIGECEIKAVNIEEVDYES